MKRKPTKKMALRSHIAFLGLSLFMLALVGNLFYIQIINGEKYRLKAERLQLSDTVVSAHRGAIYDSNMKVIAQSASAYLVYINPSKIETDAQKALVVDGLSNILEVDRETVLKKAERKTSGYEKILGKIDQSKKDELSSYISEHSNDKLSNIIGIDPDTKRYYPLGSFASSIVGFTGSEDVGRSGLELYYNSELTGTSGRIITAKNAMQGAMPNDYETTHDATDGYSLVLTIDEPIQYYLEQQLVQAIDECEAKYAYGIVMDVETGAVLGMASMPDYDLNTPYTISSANVLEEIKKLETDELKEKANSDALFAQWRNRVVSDSYEPGSVFKLFVAAAGLEEGIITTESTYNCTGQIKVANYYQHCFHNTAHGVQTLHEALPYSCNTFFITLGQKLGREKFFKYFEAFGFTTKTGIDLPAEAAPKEGVTYYGVDKLGISELSSESFGQTFQITPIQMISAIASLGNEGRLMTPYVVSKVLDSDGNIIRETKPNVKRQVVSESTAKTIASLMEEVVISGTAKNAYVAGYHICGKTGTSEKLTALGENIASFAGFAPANDPKIAVLIAIDEPHGATTTGGSAAAPVAGRIFENVLAYLNITPQYSDSELESATMTAPNLVGQSTTAAVGNASKFTVRVVGSGDKVISQVPSSGQSMPKGGVIVVYTEENAARETGEVPPLTGLSVAEANRAAVNAGFNIKISGTTQASEVITSYRQSVPAGTKAELGTTITVYFRSDQDVSD